MQVLVVSHLYPAFAHDLKGTFVRSQAHALARAGCTVVVVAPRILLPWPGHVLSARQRQVAAAPELEPDGPVSVVRPRVVGWPRHWGYHRLASRYLAAAERCWPRVADWRPDVMHAHVAYPDGAAAVGLARRVGVPAVVTVHGRDVNWTLRQPRIRPLALAALRGAAAVVAVSNSLARELACEGIAAQVVPNGVEEAFMAPAPPTLRADPEPVIITVGNLVPGKGHEEMLRALSSLAPRRRFRYRVVGGGPLARQLQGLGRRLGLESRVDWVGPLPHTQIPRALSGAHIFALSSQQEGFGIACLEAMAMGLPVVVAGTAGIADLLEHQRNAWILGKDQPGHLVEGLEALLASPELRQHLGRAAWQTARDGYSWDQSARRLLTTYEGVVGSGA